jgi:hypothetical protein
MTGISPAMSTTWGTNEVDSSLKGTANVAGAAYECAGHLAEFVSPVDGRAGRPDAAREDVDIGLHHGFELVSLDLGGTDEPCAHTGTARLRHVVLVDDLVDETPMPLWDLGLDCLSAVVFGHPRRQHKVDPERSVAHKPPNLGELVAKQSRRWDAQRRGVG